MSNFSLPLRNAAHETEAQEYASNYGCTIEKARLDVYSEYNSTPTAVDDFYDRTEYRGERDMQCAARDSGFI